MRGATLYLNEMLEEREREQRRRSRKAFGGAIVVALLGLAAAMREGPPKIVVQKIFVRVPVDRIVTRTETVEKRVIVHAAAPPEIELLPLRRHTIDLVGEATATRHLCVTPKRINFCGATVNDRVIVSNVGGAPIRITRIGTIPQRSGFVVNADECEGKELGAGERCEISVTLREARGETMYLVIANDAGDPPDAIRVETPPATASPARPAPAT
jgi:hypothetical protein